MHIFIPYFDASSAENALSEASRIARPGDRVTVMAAVIVPGGLPVDAEAGTIWKQVCRAERQLFHARDVAERILPRAVSLRFVRVQAYDRATAIRTGAAHYRAELVLLDTPKGLRGALSLRFGIIAAVLRDAPWNVRFVGAMTTKVVAEPIAAAPLSTLQVIAVNPALVGSRAEERARTTEGKYAS
ncbi:MAG: hypothetical protein M3176_09820 [Chloroflexota bacterium]|nr:hypothetical protein [Chloroflexota bacterium]